MRRRSARDARCAEHAGARMPREACAGPARPTRGGGLPKWTCGEGQPVGSPVPTGPFNWRFLKRKSRKVDRGAESDLMAIPLHPPLGHAGRCVPRSAPRAGGRGTPLDGPRRDHAVGSAGRRRRPDRLPPGHPADPRRVVHEVPRRDEAAGPAPVGFPVVRAPRQCHRARDHTRRQRAESPRSGRLPFRSGGAHAAALHRGPAVPGEDPAHPPVDRPGSVLARDARPAPVRAALGLPRALAPEPASGA